MSDHTGADGEGQGATPAGSGCRPADRAAARPAPAGFHPSRVAFLQKAMRFIDYIAGDGEVEITTLQGEHLASADLCKEFAAIHGCQIWDEAYSIAIGYQPDAPGGEAAQAAETCKGSAEGEHPVTEGEAPDQIPAPMSEPAEEKIARLTRERDEMATQAAACAEEVDRVRVEIGAVQAEVERLKGELAAVNNEFGSQTPDWPEAWKRVADLKQLAGDRWRDNVDLKEQVHVLREDLTRVLAERNEARTALAESERKRVEVITSEQAAILVRMLEPLARADRAIGEEPGPFRFETGTGYRDLLREDLRSAGEAYCRLKAASTPSQETPNAQG